MSLKSASELLDFRASHCGLPPLGLNVYDIKAKAVFVNDTIYTFIATATDGFPRFLSGAAIAHFHEYVYDEAFEKRRGALSCKFK